MLYIVDMNKKYIKYINYIINDIELPYLKCLEQYGLKQGEMGLVLSKVFNQPVTIKGRSVYDSNNNEIYFEGSNGVWVKREYGDNGNVFYYENSDGEWGKYEYDTNGNNIYYEDSDGYWVKQGYNQNNNRTYYENSDGIINDNR